MSAGFEGGMILVAAVVIVGRVIHDLIEGPAVDVTGLGLGLMAAAMLVNGGVGLYLVGMGRRHGSITLEADGKHLLSDAVTSIGVLIALLLVRLTGLRILDPLAALAVAIYIGLIGVSLLRRSAAGLMDEQDVEDEKRLTALLDRHLGRVGQEPQICSYHKLRHRHSGRYHWVDFHIMVPAGLSVAQGHEIASAIEYEIEQMLGEANATAHIEPCVGRGCVTCREASGSGSRGLGSE
jgi:cation diffusion facilitator family transporter